MLFKFQCSCRCRSGQCGAPAFIVWNGKGIFCGMAKGYGRCS